MHSSVANRDRATKKYRRVITMLSGGVPAVMICEIMGLTMEQLDGLFCTIRKTRGVDIKRIRFEYRLYTPLDVALKMCGEPIAIVQKPKPKKREIRKRDFFPWWGFITHESEIVM